LTNNPKEIVDIDAGDVNNELAAVEYLEDIYKFYKMIEVTIKHYMIFIFTFDSFMILFGV
jgi:hypothetical protein